MSGPEEELRRGVENPRVVDGIRPDPATDEVVLTILEQRPWGSVAQQLQQLEDKLNSYFGYVLDGFLARDYPQYAGKPVCIELACPEPPGPREQGFMTALRNYAQGENIRFVVVTGAPEP